MAPIRTFTPSGSAASRAPWGLALIIALGLIVRLLEGWSTQESIYFAFVSRLTIGYGDLSPTSLLTCSLASHRVVRGPDDRPAGCHRGKGVDRSD
jgi:Ion channel